MCEFVPPMVDRYTPQYISEPEQNIKFKIPLYQRLFTWKKETIEVLLKDLQDHFKNSKTSSTPYYLGIITQIYEKEHGSNDGYFVVLDGQQRITVLMLLAAYLSRYYDNWKRFLFHGNGYELNRPSGSGNDAKPGADKAGLLRLWPFARDDDKACLLQLIYQHPNSLENKEKTLLEQGYETIEKFFSTHFLTDKDDDNLREFSENIFERLTLLVTNLSPTYLTNPEYLNRYFEIMNSNYKNLAQHEVLKVRLATGAQNARELFSLWEICENFSENVVEILKKRPKKNLPETELPSLKTSPTLRDYVVSIANSLQNSVHPKEDTKENLNSDILTQNSQGDFAEKVKIVDIGKAYYSPNSKGVSGGRSIINFPHFLLLALDIFLDMKNGIPLPSEQLRKHYEGASLLETFKNGSKCFIPDRLEDFFEFLLQLRVLLDMYVIRRKDDNEESYSVLLGRLKEEDEKKEALWEPKNTYCRLAQYQAMLDVAFPEVFYTWLKPYLRDLYECHFGNPENKDWLPKDPVNAAAFLLGELKARDNQRVLRESLRENSPFEALDPESLTYTKIDRYWFWRLDYYLWERCGEEPIQELLGGKDAQRAVMEYRMRGNRSIEHLYPQHPQKSLPSGTEPNLHSFGNLAMISSSFNSQQSNHDVGDKFIRVASHIAHKKLQSLKLLAMFQAAGGKEGGWNKATAKAHEKRMLEILLESFQGELQGKQFSTGLCPAEGGESRR